MSNYKIESGIPVSSCKIGGPRNPNSLRGTIRRLKVGESFYANCTKATANGTVQAVRAEDKSLRFAVRVEGTGHRIWRVA